MPDPNAPDHPENIPSTPNNFHVAEITDKEINVGWHWCIDRVGRIPQGTHAHVIPYKEEYSSPLKLQALFNIFDKSEPMFGPQPAFRVVCTSNIPDLGIEQELLKPDTEYLLAFASFNEAGRSDYFGNFEKDTGTITPIKLKAAGNG